jgi:hypothetical protein
MRLSLPMVDVLVDTLAARLNGGALHIYDATNQLPQLLVAVPCGDPAFESSRGGLAQAMPFPLTRITASGEASYAEWRSADDALVAELDVMSADDLGANQADVIVERRRFEQGGVCAITRAWLRLPRQP